MPNSPTPAIDMVLVAVASNQRLVTLDIALECNGAEAWFTVSCLCGCDEGATIVSLDGEARWLAGRLVEAIERLSTHERRIA